MMVINCRDKKIWIGLGAVLIVIVLAWGLGSHYFPAAKNEQPASSQQSLENNIVNKLDERREQKGFFAEYRMERESLRSKQIEMISQVLNDPGVDKVAKQAASLRLTQIGDDIEKEMKMESLIKSRGFTDCVVIPQTDAITVVISANRLTTQQETDVRTVVGKAKAQGGKILITLIEP